MGDAIVRLAQKLDPDHVALTRIFIPPYPRLVAGRVQNVDGYWRDIGSLEDLTPDELEAVDKAGGPEASNEYGEQIGVWRPRVTPLPPFRDLAEAREMPKFEIGDRVIVAHELGDEEGTVSSFGPNDPLVTVTFDDGTNSSWPRNTVSKVRRPRLQVTDEGIFDVTGQPDLDPPDLPGGGNLPTAAADLTPSGHRPLNRIAAEIYDDWKQPNFAAKPYLEALRDLRDIQDTYGYDSASSVVAYFLSNASSWRGPKAKEIKAELNAILKKS